MTVLPDQDQASRGAESVQTFAQKLEDARAEVARLERYAATATCREVGCDMQSIGGMWCGCEDGSCSVPVLRCTRCGDCDYGDNPEAAEKRAACAADPDCAS